jgi:hypothetical protein
MIGLSPVDGTLSNGPLSFPLPLAHDLHIRDSNIRAGYAFPREPGLPHSGVLVSKRGKETHDHRGEMSLPNIRAVARLIEKIFGRKGRGRYSPARNTGEG